VFASLNGPETRFGADLHVVYRPDPHAGDPAADDSIQWIQDTPQTGVQSPVEPGQEPPGFGEHTFLAETFLVRDTGHRTAAGTGIVEVYGGLRWGWHAYQLP
jgi:hypothetical protein